MAIALPEPIRNYFIARYLSKPEPLHADFGTGTPEPFVPVPFDIVAAALIKHGVDLLPTLDAMHDAGLIVDMKIGGVRIVGLRKPILDLKPAPAPSKAGRKADPETPKIAATVREERDKQTPWKDIPAIVAKRHMGKMLSIETLKDMMKPSKRSNSKSK